MQTLSRNVILLIPPCSSPKWTGFVMGRKGPVFPSKPLGSNPQKYANPFSLRLRQFASFRRFRVWGFSSLFTSSFRPPVLQSPPPPLSCPPACPGHWGMGESKEGPRKGGCTPGAPGTAVPPNGVSGESGGGGSTLAPKFRSSPISGPKQMGGGGSKSKIEWRMAGP